MNMHPRQKEAYKYVGKKAGSYFNAKRGREIPFGYYIYYGGARGGGKSRFCLDASVSVALQIPNIEIVVVRKTHKELLKRFINPLQHFYPDEIFGYNYREKDGMAYFENGATISFQECENAKDAEKIQGQEYQLMIIDEANQYSPKIIDLLSGSLRATKVHRGFTPTLITTGNPGGISDLYFKSHFVRPDINKWRKQEILQKEKYIFIPAKVEDNPDIDDSYISWLEGLPDKLRAAWLDGNWDTFQGQFFDEFNIDVHVVPTFEIPEHWVRQSGMDMGYTDEHPCVVLWGAQDPKDNTIYVYREYYASATLNVYMKQVEYYEKGETVSMRWADPSMWYLQSKEDYSTETPASLFLNYGLPLMQAQNKRINGWRVLKQWLHWTTRRPPKLRIMDSCAALIETLPTLKYNENSLKNMEDMDTRQKYDDFGDALRYLIVNGFNYPITEPDDEPIYQLDGGTVEIEVEHIVEDEEKERQRKMDRFRAVA
jgi:phage terminase large subunit